MGRFRLGEGEPKLGYGSMCMTKMHKRSMMIRESKIRLIDGGIGVVRGVVMAEWEKAMPP